MRILFLSGGARESTLAYLLERRENVVGVVTPRPSAANRRFEGVIRAAERHGVPVHFVDKENTASVLKELSFDMLLSCGFSFLISKYLASTLV